MGRLIDVAPFEVIAFQGKSDEFIEGAKYILEMIDAQPTAFDVDKVVEQLEKLELFHVYGYGDEMVNVQDAIEIVREGGKE